MINSGRGTILSARSHRVPRTCAARSKIGIGSFRVLEIVSAARTGFAPRDPRAMLSDTGSVLGRDWMSNDAPAATPGWYPVAGGGKRYWNGYEWTTDVIGAPTPEVEWAALSPTLPAPTVVIPPQQLPPAYAPQGNSFAQPAGWYPGPTGLLQWWDGRSWGPFAPQTAQPQKEVGIAYLLLPTRWFRRASVLPGPHRIRDRAALHLVGRMVPGRRRSRCPAPDRRRNLATRRPVRTAVHGARRERTTSESALKLQPHQASAQPQESEALETRGARFAPGLRAPFA